MAAEGGARTFDLSVVTPEGAFYMVGTIEEAIEKGKELAGEEEPQAAKEESESETEPEPEPEPEPVAA